jgi:L-fucose mutarotase/ribose pyranase (RbsD/FucU family)
MQHELEGSHHPRCSGEILQSEKDVSRGDRLMRFLADENFPGDAVRDALLPLFEASGEENLG